MKIVVTDGYTLNSGDLNWEDIAQYGDLVVYERTPVHLVEERCKEATIVLTNKVPFSREILEQLPHLKLIAVTATGYNIIDVAAAKEKCIVVCNVPGYGTASVAQHVFALLLELTNAVGRHSRSVSNGDWYHSPDWSYTLQPLVELDRKTMGIIGMGNIGKRVALIAGAFGMAVIYHNWRPKPSPVGKQKSLHEVFRESDVISLHCPLTPETNGMVNKDLLHQMKKNAFLINTARGPLIHEEDLTAALNEERIAGAALDVLSIEPPTGAQRILTEAKNCIVTPHNAWMSKEARTRMLQITAQNIRSFLEGQPINKVN